jgi:hypothetical protein
VDGADLPGGLSRAAVDDVEAGTVLLSNLDAQPDLAIARVPWEFRHLVEDVLLQRGWRLEHPAVRGVLLGPDGQRVDAAALVGGALREPDLGRFRQLLSDTGAVLQERP